MKAGNIIYFGHEAGYLVFLVITLAVLTELVFPLLIAFLPVAILYCCLEIWRLDHLKNHKGLGTH